VIRLSQLIGQPAVALADASHVGKVDGAVVRQGRLVAITAGKTVIPSHAVRAFEGDAVTFDAHDPVGEDLAAGAGPVIGRVVLTPEGNALGPVVDLDLDDRGVVQTVELRDRTMPGSQLLVVGSYAAIMTEEEPQPLPPPEPSQGAA
jgi:uncharacterized protein YrrD